jgi:hypothetical protein
MTAGNRATRRAAQQAERDARRNARKAQAPRRPLNLGAVLLGAFATIVMLLTLLGLAPLPALPGAFNNTLSQISTILIRFVTVVGAIAVIIGVFNLLNVNVYKLTSRTRGAWYSFFTLFAFLLVIGVHAADRSGLLDSWVPDKVGDSPIVSLTLMDTVQVTIESALGGVLFFSLVYAAFRMMRRRVTIWNILFLIALLIVLIGYIPMSNLAFIGGLRDWLLRVPVSAGTRALLIGVALGTVIVGIRLLIGQDRSFRE